MSTTPEMDAGYLREFVKVFGRADDVLGFDPARLAAVADWDIIRTLDDFEIRVRNWTDRFHRARQG